MITGIILASGFSRRMNRQKLLLIVGGLPLVERVVRAAAGSRLDEVLCVYQDPEIGSIAEKYGLRAVLNAQAAQGQSAAIRAALGCAHPDASGFMFMVGDQPYLDADTVNCLIEVFEGSKDTIVVPLYGSRRGNPVIFPSVFKADLLNLQGDRGGRVVIEGHPERVRTIEMSRPLVGMDIDTPADYNKILDAVKKTRGG